MSADARLDKAVIRTIVQSLNRLKQLDGIVKDDKIWSFDGIGSSRLLTRREEQASAYSGQLEAVKNALEVLTASCERRLTVVNSIPRGLAEHAGINSLPDDVLCAILTLAAEEEPSLGFRLLPNAVQISHVCSRFRTLALATPQLWSTLGSDSSESLVQTFLERSKDVGLSIWVGIDRFSIQPEGRGVPFEALALALAARDPKLVGKVRKFLNIVRGHSKRWSSLHCVIYKYTNKDSILAAIDYLARLDLPRVDTFEIFCNLVFYEDIPTRDLTDRWTLPKLRHLRLASIQPSQNSRFYSSPTITSVYFSWYRSDRQNMNLSIPDLQEIADFLASLPSLVDLRIEMSLLSPIDEDEEDIILPPTKQFTLSRLASLELDMRDMNAFISFLHGMDVPTLRKLHLTNTFNGPWYNAISGEKFETVQELRYERRHDYSHALVDLRALLGKFPCLEQLEMIAPNNSCPYFDVLDYSADPQKLPPLKSLSLTLEAPLTGSFLRAFIRELSDENRWETFKTFKFKWVGGKSMDDELEEMRQSGKEVIWYE